MNEEPDDAGSGKLKPMLTGETIAVPVTGAVNVGGCLAIRTLVAVELAGGFPSVRGNP